MPCLYGDGRARRHCGRITAIKRSDGKPPGSFLWVCVVAQIGPRCVAPMNLAQLLK